MQTQSVHLQKFPTEMTTDIHTQRENISDAESGKNMTDTKYLFTVQNLEQTHKKSHKCEEYFHSTVSRMIY